MTQLENDLKRDEGKRSCPYKDTTGHLTIGYGHNLDAEGLCEVAMLVQLKHDIHTKALAPLDSEYPWWRSTPDSVQRGMANLMFNMGPAVLSQFVATLDHLKAGRYDEAAEQLVRSRYASQVGQRAYRIAQLFRQGA